MRRLDSRRPFGVPGFTLVEIIVALALGLILMGIVAATASQLSRASEISEAQMVSTRDIHGALGRVARDLSGIIPATSLGTTLRMSRTEVDGDADFDLRADVLSFVAHAPVDGVRTPARIRYSLEAVEGEAALSTRLFRRVQPLIAELGDYVDDPAGGDFADVLLDGVDSFTVRYLPRSADPGGTEFIDPDQPGGLTDTGSAFSASGNDGRVVLGNDGSVTLLVNREIDVLRAIEPGSRVFLSPAAPTPGFSPSFFIVLGTGGTTTNTSAALAEHLPPADPVSFLVVSQPRAIEVEIRVRKGYGNVSLTRTIRLGKS